MDIQGSLGYYQRAPESMTFAAYKSTDILARIHGLKFLIFLMFTQTGQANSLTTPMDAISHIIANKRYNSFEKDNDVCDTYISPNAITTKLPRSVSPNTDPADPLILLRLAEQPRSSLQNAHAPHDHQHHP